MPENLTFTQLGNSATQKRSVKDLDYRKHLDILVIPTWYVPYVYVEAFHCTSFLDWASQMIFVPLSPLSFEMLQYDEEWRSCN